MGTLIVERASGARLEVNLASGVKIPQLLPGDRVTVVLPDGRSVLPQVVENDVVIVLPASPTAPEQTLVLKDLAVYLDDEETALSIVDEATGEAADYDDPADLLSDVVPAAGETEPSPPAETATQDSALRPTNVLGPRGLDSRGADRPDQSLLDEVFGPEALAGQPLSFRTGQDTAFAATGRRESGSSALSEGTDGAGETSPETPSVTVTGQAIDGYIVGATVFLDADEDGVQDPGEAFAVTGANGAFTLTGGSGPLVMTGGIDISTNQFFKGTLTAPEGSTVVTPLTTLMQALIDNGSAANAAQAEQQVKTAFGLSGDIDLTTFDPVVGVELGTPGADAVMSTGIQLQNTIVQAASSLNGAAGPTVAVATAIEVVYSQVAASLKSDPNSNPIGTATQVEALINAAATFSSLGLDAAARSQVSAAAPSVATIIDDSNQTVSGSSSTGSLLLDALASVALVGQNKSATALFEAFDQVQGTGDPVDLTSALTSFSSAGNLDAEITQAATEIGSAGFTSPVGTPGDDTINGGAGNDVLDGGAGNDVISGAGGRDNLIGGSGNDSLSGDTGDDVLSGGTGSNILNGGAGIDVAQFTGRFSDHQISASLGVLTVSYSDSTDQVRTVETLKFDDLAVRVVGGDSSFADFAAAVNAATSGDRVLLIGTATTPDTMVLSKRVSVETSDGLAVFTASDGALVVNADALSGTTKTLDISGLPGTTAVRFTGSLSFDEIVTGPTQTLTLPVDQLDGLAVSGTGTLQLTGQTVPGGADLSGLSVNISLPAGQSLNLTAAQADGLSISGAGDVAVTALGSGKADLSGIAVTGSKTAAVPATTTLALGTDLGGFSTDVAAGQTLTLTAAQVSGKPVAGAGSVTVTGAADDTDLSGVTVSGTLAATVISSVDLSANTTLGAVDSYAVSGSLTISAAQADGLPITGAGNVDIVGLGTGAVDLSSIVSSGTKSATIAANTALNAATDLGAFAATVSGGQLLTLSAAQADGRSITGNGDVLVTALGAAPVDLSPVLAAGTKTATLATDTALNAASDLGGFRIDLSGGQSITLTAAQADGLSITGNGNVTVTGLGAASVDLSSITATGTRLAQVPATATLANTTDLGGFGVSVAAGQTLTLSAAQANSVAVGGPGNVLVTALGDAEVNLSQVTAAGSKTASVPANATLNSNTDLGSFDVVVSSGQTLRLSAAQASGHAISGSGNVEVTALGAGQVDLSQVVASGTKTANVPSSATLNASTDLGAFSVVVANGETLTLSATQADNQTITSGSVSISGDIAANTDLTKIGSALGFVGGTIDVASGQTLTLTMVQASGKTISGAGAVLVQNDVASSADLTGVTPFLEFTGNTVSIAAGQTLTLTAVQANDVGITGSGTLLLSGVAPGAADYNGITADISVPSGGTLLLDAAQLAALDNAAKPIAGPGTVALTGDARSLGTLSGHVTADLSVPSGSLLTLTAAQANGVSLAGAGDVSITALGSGAVDLAGIAATGSVVAITTTDNPTLNAATDLGGVTVRIPTGHSATMSAAQASGKTITGAGGTLVITGEINGSITTTQWQAETIDLRGATIAPGVAELTLPQTSELLLTYTQAHQLGTINGTPDSNRLTIDVSGATFDASNEATINLIVRGEGGDDHIVIDFGSLTDHTIILSGSSEIDLGAGTADRLEASNGTVDIAAAAVSGVEQLAINSTISMSATQFQALADLSALEGAGEVLITVGAGFDTNQTLDFSGLGFIPGGSTPPTIKIDATANGGFTSLNIQEPENANEPVAILVQYAGDTDYSAVGGFLPGRSFFTLETTVFTGAQFAALVTAIENNETGVSGTQASVVETIKLDGNIALSTNVNMSTDRVDGVEIDYNGRSIEVTGGRQFTMTAAQANGGTITGAGSLDITDLQNAPSSLDLTGIANNNATLEVSSGPLDLTGISSLSLGDVTLTVTGTAVTMTAAQANGHSVEGTGSVVLTALGTAAVDLSGITATGGFSSTLAGNLTLSSLTDLGTLQLALAQGATLGLSPGQLDGRTIGLDTGATSATLRFGGDVSNLTLGGIHKDLGFTVSSGRNMTLAASQANGRDITGAGNVFVTQLGADPVDLSGVVAAGIKSANVPSPVTLSGSTNLGDFALTVSDGATLRLNATQANGVDISGAGGVTVTALGSNPVNLSTISVGGARTVELSGNPVLDPGTDLQGFAVTVTAGQTLTLSATQADGLSISGAGSVVITGLGSEAVDLSGITASAVAEIDSGDVTLSLGTDLGTVALDLAAAASLTLTAAQADARTIVGAGSVTVIALDSGTDLSSVNATVTLTAQVISTLDISANTTLGPVDVYDVIGDLTLSAAQADGTGIAGAGNVTIAALAAGTDLSNVTATGSISATVTSAIDISGNASLTAIDSYLVEAGGTLTLAAAQASGTPITGLGNVTVVSMGGAPVDLSSVVVGGNTQIDIQQTATLAQSTDLAGFDVAVASGAVLTLTAEQADGLSITGAGQVVVTDPVGTSFDLSGITTGGATGRTMAVTDTLALADGTNLGTFAVTVAAGETMTLSSAQATGRGIGGAGNVTVTGLAADADLSGASVTGSVIAQVSSAIDVTGNANLGSVDAYQVTGGLTLRAAQADGRVIAGTGSATVTELGTGAVDLSGITAAASAAVPTGDLTLASGTALGSVAITVAAGASLTLSAAQASGATINGPGDVNVTALSATTDLTGVDPTGTLTALVDSTLDISGNIALGTVDVFQVSGALTLTAEQANARTVNGTGAVTVVDPGPTAFDLSGITASGAKTVEVSSSFTLASGTNLGAFGVTVAADQTLALTGAQASGLAIAGAGNVTVTPMEQAADLSDVTVTGTVTVQAGTNLDLAGNATLGVVDAYHVLGNLTLTLTGAQASGHSITGPGAVIVRAITGGIDLSGVSALGTITATVESNVDVSANTTLEVVDIIQVTAGGKVTLTASQADARTINGAGDVTVTNFGANAIDLSTITAAGILTVTLAGDVTVPNGTDFGSFGIFVDASQTLTITAQQADGMTMTGTGIVVVTGDPDGLDFSGIAGTLTVFFPDGGETLTIPAGETVELTVVEASAYDSIEGDGTLGLYENGEVLFDSLNIAPTLTLVVPADRNLTLTAAQSSGLVLGGDGTLVVTGAVTNGDFSAVTSSLDLSGATLTGTLTLPAEIAAGKTITLSGEQADGVALGGDGALVVTGAVTNGDFSAITANLDLSGATLTGTLTLPASIAAGKTITLTAQQANGQALAGDGTLVVVGAGADGSTVDTTDLSSVQLDTVFASLGALTRIVTNETQKVEIDAADLAPISDADGTLTIAGQAAIDVVDAQLQTFFDGTPPSVRNLLALEFEGLSAERSIVPDRLTVDGSHTDAIKSFWIPLDQAYVGADNYLNLEINTSFVYLGNDYVRYLNAGGAPLLDIVKVPAGRAQALHDNLLGNLGDGPIGSRFPIDETNPEDDNDPRTDPAKEFGDRPYHDGSIAGGVYSKVNALSGVMGWDIAHGIDYPSSLPSFYAVIDGDNTIAGTAGKDYLFGGAGDDTLNAGAGDDSAVYQGSQLGFAVSTDPATLALSVDDIDLTDGDEGTDTVTDAKTLLFNDGFVRVEAQLARAVPENNPSDDDGFHPGSGLKDTDFVISDNTDVGVEAALKIHNRYAGEVPVDGTIYHTGVGLSSSTAGLWNFNYSVITYDGRPLSDFDIVITADFIDLEGNRTDDVMVFDAVAHEELTNEDYYNDGTGQTDGLQNSQNIGWYATEYDAHAPGTYELTLSVTDQAGNQVTRTTITVDVAADFTVAADGSGDFTSIQDAVNAASAGDTIAIAAGTYAEAVSVNKALHFYGAGSDNTIVTPPSGSGFFLTGNLGAANTVSFNGIGFVGGTHSGLRAENVTLGTLKVTDSHFEGNQLNGFHVLNDVTGSPNTNLASVMLTDSTFLANGQPGSSNGDGDIIFYQYNGDATLRNLQVDGGNRPIGEAGGAGENGIQFRSDFGALGSVDMEQVSVTGNYEKVGIAFYRFDDVNGLSMTDVNVTSTSGWQLSFNFDGIGGDIDLSAHSGLTFTQVAALQGENGVVSGNTFTGTEFRETVNARPGDDVVYGGAGDDTLNGGDGNDTITGGAGNDTINGGAGTDTVSYFLDAAGVTVNLSSGSATDGGGGADSLSNVENVVGSNFDDTLQGDDADNVLTAHSGNDRLTGDAGNDRFVIEKDDTGTTTVTDFSVGDVLDFTDVLDGGPTTDLQYSDVGGNVEFRSANDGFATVIAVAESVSADDMSVDADGNVTLTSPV